MLSVVPIKNSSISTGYYLAQDGGYYIENAEDKSLYVWFGKGADKLGLTGLIDPKDHTKTFTGELPDDTQMGKRDPDGTFTGRPGYDLTFSANKEISLMISCSQDDELKNALRTLHHDAVKESMSYLERLISARKTKNGVTKYETTGNMVSALCTHFTSRAGDPDIHTHALLANMTECSDGKWRALSTDMSRKQGIYEIIRDQSKLLGHIYQNHMEQGVRALGFETSSIYKHGMFEIKGFDEQMKRHFSKRREDMISKVGSMANATVHDKELMNKIASNKPTKVDYKPGDFEQKAQSDMTQYIQMREPNYNNFDEHIKSIKDRVKEKVVTDKKTTIAVKNAIDYLSKYATKLPHHKIVEKAFEQSKEPLLLDKIELAIKDLQSHHYLTGRDGLYETQANQFDAKRLQTSVEKTKDNIKIVKQSMYTNEAQSQLDTIINDAESYKKRALVLASNRFTAVDHNEYARSKHKTIWQKLTSISKSDRAVNIHSFLYRKDSMNINERDVLIVDDAQRMNIAHCQDLVDLSKKTGCQLIFMEFDQGRRSQLAGNALSIIKSTDVPYDKSSKDREYVCEMKTVLCEPADKINKTKVTEYQAKLDALADKAIKEGADKIDIIANSNKEKSIITTKLREKLITSAQSLQAVTIKVDKSVYHKGNINNIHAGMSIREYDQGKYRYHEIKRIDRKTNTVVIDGLFGREKRYKADDVLKKYLVKQDDFEIRDNERVIISSLGPTAKKSGLVNDKPYRVELTEKGKLHFHSLDSSSKPIKVSARTLEGVNISYDYVKTLNQLSSQKRTDRLAIVSVSPYGSFKPAEQDIKRSYKRAELYCQNSSSQKRIDKGIDAKNPTPKYLVNHQVGTLSEQVKEAVSYAVDTIASRTSTFTIESVAKKSLDYGIDAAKELKLSKQEVSKMILKELRTQVKEGDIVYKQKESGSILLATKTAIDHEQKIIDLIKDTKNTVEPYLPEKSINDKLEQTNLTDGQKSACRMIATTKDKFNMVQGYAGTGKSTMLRTLIQSLEESKVISTDKIIALAPTHRAVKELKEKGIEATTLQRFLIDHQTEPKNYDDKMILVDEMSMIGTTQYHDFMSIVAKSNAKCIQLGDNNQLQPVPSGAPSTLAFISDKAGINRAIMHEIKRQETPHLQEAVSHLVKNNISGIHSAISVLQKNNCIVEAPLRIKTNVDNPTIPEQKNSNKTEVEEPKTSIDLLAEEYASLSEQERSETMIITPTNALRHEINEAVRAKLIENDNIKGETLSLVIYEDSSLTDRELMHTKNYQVGNKVKHNNVYGEISSIDHLNKRMVMTANDGKAKIINLSDDKTIMEKYYDHVIEIQSGDQLKWTKTDYDRGVLSHEKLSVLAINANDAIIQVKDEEGSIFDIDLKLEQNKHIDYAYASTIYGSQGATVKRVLGLFNSESKLANSVESLYVAITRATHIAKIYTQKASDLVNSIVSQKESDQIVLRAFDMLDDDKDRTNTSDVKKWESDPEPKVEHPSPTPTKTKASYDAKEISAKLSQQAEMVCEHLLGKPNQSLSSSSNWRYGSKGALSVFVSGARQGTYKNFETDDGGDLIKLIMDVNELEFKPALEQASRLLGHIPEQPNKPKIDLDRAVDAKKSVQNAEQKKQRMQKLVDRSSPIQGSIVEKYLKSRGIEAGNLSDIRVIKRVNTGFKNNEIRPFASALLGISRDEKGQMSAIQMTYLDPMSGQKIGDLPIKKRSMGTLKGSVVELKTTQDEPKFCFAAEGIETALSIKNALEEQNSSQATVVATLGISNFSHLDKATKAQNIVLILDNDGVGAQSEKMIDKAIIKLKEAGKTVLTMKPEMLNDQKTDYNDLLKAGKMDLIKADIERTIGQKEINIESSNGTKIDHTLASQPPRIAKNIREDRELFG